MSKTQKTFTILLALIAVVLVGLQQTDNDDQPKLALNATEQPSYESQHMTTMAYEPTGMLGYKLVADEVKHYTELKNTWFTKPFMTIFDKNANASWTVRADKANLTNSRQLYLYGNITVNNLDDSPQIKQILANEAHIDLVTQNITSDSEVTILGPSFSSTGLKMKGNLREKAANLIENVKTNYMPGNKN